MGKTEPSFEKKDKAITDTMHIPDLLGPDTVIKEGLARGKKTLDAINKGK